MHRLAQLDHQYIWHPFTQMRDWLQQEPIIIESGNGAVLRDIHGRDYLDANSSIWTNLHGHQHPRITAAIKNQLDKIAHSSALGLGNQPASLLAERLIKSAQPRPYSGPLRVAPASRSASSALAGPETGTPSLPMPSQPGKLAKVFYSDDGSTAMEVALKLAYEYHRRTRRSKKPKFISIQGAYHGDTIGAVSLGHIDLFHKAYRGLLFPTQVVKPPYCYRCPHNRAKPERDDARQYRRCRWECLEPAEAALSAKSKQDWAGVVVEPVMQGAAGMIAQPPGWLSRLAKLARHHRTLLIADEVMTGFGRTGPMFATQAEEVQPDLMAVAKGLTGGYLPLAATLTSNPIFEAFLGEYAEFKTFFHGHSYTANQLGCAAALASLDLLEDPKSIRQRHQLIQVLNTSLQSLWSLPQVGDIRQAGLVVGVELVKDWRTRTPYPLEQRAGIRVCQAATRRGVLTRPIGNVLVIMPPYCMTPRQIRQVVEVFHDSIAETLKE